MITVVEPKAELVTPVDHLLDYSKLIESAARICWKSEDKIKECSDIKIIRSLVKRGHLSVIEHCSVSYRFTCSRACSHQLVRHRLGAISQESMRYCDYSKLGFQVIMPPSIKELSEQSTPYLLFMMSVGDAYDKYLTLRKVGIPPEDARFLLPNASKTELVMSYNLRMWRHIIKERYLNPHAQWEIKSLLKAVLYELYHYIPVFFEDLLEEVK